MRQFSEEDILGQRLENRGNKASLVVQWLRIHLPMQGEWVPPLVGELRSHLLLGQISVCVYIYMVAQTVNNLPAMEETWVQSLGPRDPLEEGMVTHSSILAWIIPGTQKPGWLQSIGWHRIGHN